VDGIVVAVEYGNGHEIPAPDRFFRVSRAEFTTVECAEPPGRRPWI
jgi:hypothetical protein